MSIAVDFFVPVFLRFFSKTGRFCLFCGTPGVTLKNPELLFVSGYTNLGSHLPNHNRSIERSIAVAVLESVGAWVKKFTGAPSAWVHHGNKQ